MSRPSRHDRSGFTLLECEIGILILTLLAVGLANLMVSHDRLVADVETWLADDPVYYVDQHDLHFKRTIGCPATLSADPVAPPAAPVPDAFDVTVQTLTLGLYPPTATATVEMVPNP